MQYSHHHFALIRLSTFHIQVYQHILFEPTYKRDSLYLKLEQAIQYEQENVRRANGGTSCNCVVFDYFGGDGR